MRPAPLVRGEDGSVRVGGTRVSLETIVMAFDAGATAEEILQQYPSLDLPSVYAIISYVLDNRAEVDGYMDTRRADVRALQGQIEAITAPIGLRARLLSRRSSAHRP